MEYNFPIKFIHEGEFRVTLSRYLCLVFELTNSGNKQLFSIIGKEVNILYDTDEEGNIISNFMVTKAIK